MKILFEHSWTLMNDHIYVEWVKLSSGFIFILQSHSKCCRVRPRSRGGWLSKTKLFFQMMKSRHESGHIYTRWGCKCLCIIDHLIVISTIQSMLNRIGLMFQVELKYCYYSFLIALCGECICVNIATPVISFSWLFYDLRTLET